MILPFLPPRSWRFQIATNTASQLVGRAVSGVSMLAANLLIARAYGATGYGDFIKITGFVALFYLAADFGMNAVFLQKTQAVPQASLEKNDTWQTLLGVRLVGSIILVFIALAILSFLPRGSDQGYTSVVRLGIILFSPAIIFQAVITTANALFQKHLRYDLSMIAVIIGSLVTVGLVWVATLLITPLFGAVTSSLAVFVGTGVVAAASLFFVGRFVKIRAMFDRAFARELIVASVPLGVTLLFNQLYYRADTIILTLTRATADVGIYGFAYKLFETVLVVPTFFMNALYPLMLSRTHQSDDLARGDFAPLRGILKKSSVILSLGSLGAVGLLWWASPLVSLIRPEFSQSVTALRILSLSLPFFFLSSLTMWTIITLKKQTLLIPIYATSMILNVFFNILYIPRFSYIAAAWVTVVSEVLVLIMTGSVAIHQMRQMRQIGQI